MNRRSFLAAPAASLLAASRPLAAATRLPIKKAVGLGMLPKKMSYLDRFKLAVDVGFEQIECPTTPDPKDSEEIKKASEAAKLPIHSVMNMAHWQYPLSSSDPEVVTRSMKGMETSLHNAHFWGAETVLLVPAVVNPQTTYKEAWVRSQKQIRKLLPMAQELKVIIAVEEVWNKFLLSPLEFATYVDQFKSPWLRAYFDVGNVVLTGYPQDWIHTLGKRIAKLHFKDFRFRPMPGSNGNRVAEFVNLRDGDIDWHAVHDALADIGYRGTVTVELPGGDAAYLRNMVQRVDWILSQA